MDWRAGLPRAAYAPIAAVALCGVLLGVTFGWLVHPADSGERAATAGEGEIVLGSSSGDGPDSASATAADEPEQPDAPAAPGGAAAADAVSAKLAGALADAAASEAGRGTVEAAVMLDAASAPAVAGEQSPMRLWSTVKLVTALTLLGERGDRLAGLEPIFERALVQSDNCAQRKMVLELQRDLGSTGAVADAVRSTVEQAGGAIDLTLAQQDESGEHCIAPGYQGLSAEDAPLPALLLGTTEWRVSDAARVAHALRAREPYGAARSDYLLGLLRRPKQDSAEPGAGSQLTAPPSWGAGDVFADPCWNVAYKGGWGGTAQASYLVEQIGTVDLPGGRWGAFAVAFRPSVQPPDDDPGKAQAPEVLATVLGALERGLRAEFPDACS